MTDLSKLVDFCSSTTKNIISPLLQCLWPPRIESCRLIMTGFYPYHHEANVIPCDKLKKLYISTFIRLMVSKLGRVLTSGRRFRTKTLKSSPIFCFSFFTLLKKVQTIFACVLCIRKSGPLIHKVFCKINHFRH